jgi:hypothetical protein
MTSTILLTPEPFSPSIIGTPTSLLHLLLCPYYLAGSIIRHSHHLHAVGDQTYAVNDFEYRWL